MPRIASTLVLLLAAIVILSGCGGGSGSTKPAVVTQKTAEPESQARANRSECTVDEYGPCGEEMFFDPSHYRH